MGLSAPRTVRSTELASLSELVDQVFFGEPGAEMFCRFPQLFNAGNIDNLYVITDGSTVISHVGTMRRWASIAGCTVRVACVGAVATAEAYRNQGLASQLLEFACRQGKEDGLDFMLISGGRGLYRRYGAADVGRNYLTVLTRSHAAAIAVGDVAVDTFDRAYLAPCQAAYHRKTARFIRPRDDWESFLSCGYCMNRRSEIVYVTHRDIFAGYFVVAAEEGGHARILEYAGEDTVLAGALQALMERQSAARLELIIEGPDRGFGKMLAQAGCSFEFVPAEGTLILLNFPQLTHRLRPYFEAKAGHDKADSLRFVEKEGRYYFGVKGAEKIREGKRAAAEFLFGNPATPPPDNALGEILPAPTLHYGLNYV